MNKAPTVTQDDVNAMIQGETYTVLPDGRTTVCQLTLVNGFTVMGSSACVCKENFNAELGERYSREEAVNKVWPIAGVLLAERLHQEKKSKGETWTDRLWLEWRELADKLTKLKAMLANPSPAIQETDLKILDEQARIMGMYEEILRMRLDRARQG
ncbi:hypothetical protein KMC56_gp43 [Achromobacter phage vB_AxyP_19-32_Axy12]|uniref:Uncharacterized protein n=1 Tax=Achromobacter phage vB_AxyP_19-32_Axy12 TaxID=2591043 RepID=A0A514CUF7_9CAUD|nr:hypothetical protein KMC56_gp43 [Achromobacter phage vB_AxyP_19-32_Axy12]QDH84114.1 hypothetical protein Axy12_076 [Achromobacter phage vB_AxyP_19-32_Axy12]